MADGDFTVKVLGRFTIPGGGHSTTGGSRNNKELVWGEVDYTYNTAGLVFGAVNVGLRTLDLLLTQVNSREETTDNTRVAQTAAAPFIGVYTGTTSGTNGNLIFTDDGGTEHADSQFGIFTFLAIGDSAAPADLA